MVKAAQAKQALKDDLEHACIENIQACILIGNICLGDSLPQAELIYFGRYCSVLRADGITAVNVHEYSYCQQNGAGPETRFNERNG